jgi:hypothetical protein
VQDGPSKTPLCTSPEADLDEIAQAMMQTNHSPMPRDLCSIALILPLRVHPLLSSFRGLNYQHQVTKG